MSQMMFECHVLSARLKADSFLEGVGINLTDEGKGNAVAQRARSRQFCGLLFSIRVLTESV